MENYRENGQKSPFRRRLARILSWITGLSLGAIVLIVGGCLLALAIFVRTESFQTGLRDKILQIAKDDWGTEISYETAKLSIFQLEPSLEFSKVQLKHQASKAEAAVDRIVIRISALVSIPLLFFRELHITAAEIEGLHYRLSTTRTIDRMIANVRPKNTYIPSSFQTSIEKIRLARVIVDLDLSERDILKRATRGEVLIDEIEARLSPEQIRFGGQTHFRGIRWGNLGPYDGELKLQDGSHNLFRTVFKELKLASGPNHLSFSGEIRNWANPELKLAGDVDFKLSDFWKGSVDAQLQSKFSIDGPVKALKGGGDLGLKNLRVGESTLSNIEGEWDLNYPNLEFKRLSSAESGRMITAKANIVLDASNKSRVDLDFKNISFGRYLGLASQSLSKWKGDTTGTLKYEGLVAPELKGNFSWNLQMKDYRILSYQHETEILNVPELQIEGQGQLDGITNGTFSTSMKMLDSQWKGGGAWTSNTFDLSWENNFKGGRIGQLFSQELELVGSMKGSLKGPWAHLVMDVDQNLSLFSLDHQKIHNLKGRLKLQNRILSGDPLIADELSVTGGILIPLDREDEFSNLRFEGRNLDPQYFLKVFHLSTDWTTSLHGKLFCQGSLRGPFTHPIGSGTLGIESWNLGHESVKGRSAKGKWATAQGETFFDGIEIRSASDGEPVHAELSVDQKGIADFTLEGRRIRLQDWAYVFQMASPLQGLVDLDFDYQRSIPSLKAALKIHESSLVGAPQKDSDLSLDWSEDNVLIHGQFLGDALKIDGKINQAATQRIADFKMKFANFNLLLPIRSFFNARLELPISGNGSLHIKQSAERTRLFFFDFLTRPKEYQGRIDVDTAYVLRGKSVLKRVDAFPIEFSTSASGGMRWTFNHLKLVSDTQVLEAHGFFESISKFSLGLRGKSDIRLLAFLSDALSRSEGLMEVDGVFDPDGFNGKMEISDGLVTLANSPIVIRNVEASIRGSGSLFDLQRLQGEFREGTISASGRARVHKGQVESVQLGIKLDGSLIQPQNGISLRASGPLNLNYSNGDGKLDGKLSISEGMYRRHIDTRVNLLKIFEPEKREFKMLEDDSTTKPLNLSIGLETSEPFLIRNNLAEGAATFNLILGGNVKEPRLKGSISINRGQFKYTNREFEVRSGSIQFTDPTSNIPNYDVRADTEISEYRVNIRLLGGPSEQKIIYSSDPTLSEKDILSLIQVGIPASAPELSGQGSTRATGLSGISFVTGQIQEGIEGRLSSDLGIRRFYLVPGFYERTGQTELQLTVGTDLIKNKLEANYSTFLVSGPSGQKVELDFKVNQIVSLVGSWRDADQGVNDFGGDLRFRLEFE